MRIDLFGIWKDNVKDWVSDKWKKAEKVVDDVVTAFTKEVASGVKKELQKELQKKPKLGYKRSAHYKNVGKTDKADWTLATNEFVRALVKKGIVSQNGAVTIAVKSWKEAKGTSFRIPIPGDKNNGMQNVGTDQETRFIVNKDAVLGNETIEPVPTAFLKQDEWENSLVPGKLYRPKRNIRVWLNVGLDLAQRMPSPFSSRRKAGRTRQTYYDLKPDDILMLVEVDDAEKKEAQGQLNRHSISVRNDTTEVTALQEGILKPPGDDYYLPVVKQKWMYGEKMIEYSFVYDELEEIPSREDVIDGDDTGN